MRRFLVAGVAKPVIRMGSDPKEPALFLDFGDRLIPVTDTAFEKMGIVLTKSKRQVGIEHR